MTRAPVHSSHDGREEEAEAWFARLHSGDFSPEDRAALAEWRADSPDNEAALQRCEDAAAGVDHLATDLLAREFESELSSLEKQESYPTVTKSVAAQLAALAAGIMLLIGVTTYMFAPNRPTTFVHTTEIGERSEIALPDGGSIHLNTNSRVEVRYEKTTRVVEFPRGEALFEVEKVQKREFLVRTPHAEVTVLGTTFRVRTSVDSVSIGVQEGTVSVAPPGGGPISLQAGEEIELDKHGAPGPVHPFDADAALAWTAGRVHYDAAPLSDVVEDLNRYFDRPIYAAEELSGLPVTAEFRLDDQDAILKALKLALPVDQQWKGDRLTLVAAPDRVAAP